MLNLGDKVIVLGNPSWCSEAKADIGKRGTIVRNLGEEVGFIGEWGVHIPKSTSKGVTHNGTHYSWWIKEKELKLVREEQLLFSFMKEVADEI